MTASLVTPLILRSDFTNELAATVSTATNAAILDKIIEESERIERWCFRRFDERIDTRYFNPWQQTRGGDLDGVELMLDDDLRSVTTLTNGDGSTVSGSVYTLLPRSANRYGVTVRSSVKLNTTSGAFWTYGTNEPEQSISLLGLWGYGGQWRSTGATVTSGLASDAAAATFVSSTALEAGMTLKIGSEYIYINAVAGTTNTIDRAGNGSTAATHANASVVYRWECDPLVKRHVKRLVLISIAQDSSPLFGQLILGDFQAAVQSDGNPREVLFDVERAGLKRRAGVMAV